MGWLTRANMHCWCLVLFVSGFVYVGLFSTEGCVEFWQEKIIKCCFIYSAGCEAQPDLNISHGKYGIKLFIPSSEGMSELWLRFDSVREETTRVSQYMQISLFKANQLLFNTTQFTTQYHKNYGFNNLFKTHQLFISLLSSFSPRFYLYSR